MDVGTGSALRQIQFQRGDMLPAAGTHRLAPPILSGCTPLAGPQRPPQTDQPRHLRQAALLRGGHGVTSNLLSPLRQRALLCSSSLAEGSTADSEDSLVDDGGGPLTRGEECTEYGDTSSSYGAPLSEGSASAERAESSSDAARSAHESSPSQNQADQGKPPPSAGSSATSFGLGLPEIAAGAVFVGGLAMFLATPLRTKAPSVSAANQPPALVSVTGGAATSSTAVTSPDPATVPSTSDSGSASAGSGSSAGAQGRYTAGSSPADTPSQPPSLSPSEGVLVRRDPWHVARTPAEAEKGIWDPEAASSRRWHTRPSEGAQEPQVGPAQSGNRAAPFYRERRRGAVFVSEPEDGGPTIWELGPDGVPMRSSIGNQASRASRGPPAEYLDPSAYPWGDAGKVSDFPEFSSFSGYSDAYDLPTGPQQGGDEGEEGQGDSSGTGVTGEERSAAGTATGGMKPHVGGAFVPAPVDTKGSLVSFKQQPQPQRSRSAWKLPGLQPKAGSDSAVVVKAVVEDAQVQAVTALTLLKVLDADVDPAAICTRRQFARWMVKATGSLYSDPSKRILPAMFVEGVTDMAYDDVDHKDPDFGVIQGLAESGLIASKLSLRDLGCPKQRLLEQQQLLQQGQLGGGRGRGGRERGVAPPQPRAPASVSEPAQQIGCNSGSLFRPDTALTRQDLISWKVVLDTSEQDPGDLLSLEVSGLKAAENFLDRGNINSDAMSAVALDLGRGRSSVFSTIFGLSRRFDPHKPVTCGQAALALTLGEGGASEAVDEELARMEMDEIAEAAVEEEEEEERREEEARVASRAAQATRGKRAGQAGRGSDQAVKGSNQAVKGSNQATRGSIGEESRGGRTKEQARTDSLAASPVPGVKSGSGGREAQGVSMGEQEGWQRGDVGTKQEGGEGRRKEGQIRTPVGDEGKALEGSGGEKETASASAQGKTRTKKAQQVRVQEEAGADFGKQFVLPALSLGRDVVTQVAVTGQKAVSGVVQACRTQLQQRLSPVTPQDGQHAPRQPEEPAQQGVRAEPTVRAQEEATGQSSSIKSGGNSEDLPGPTPEGSLVIRTNQNPVSLSSLKDNLTSALGAFQASAGPALSALASQGVSLLSVGGKLSAKAMVFVGGLLKEGWLIVSSLKEPVVSWWVWAKVAMQRVKPKTRL